MLSLPTGSGLTDSYFYVRFAQAARSRTSQVSPRLLQRLGPSQTQPAARLLVRFRLLLERVQEAAQQTDEDNPFLTQFLDQEDKWQALRGSHDCVAGEARIILEVSH